MADQLRVGHDDEPFIELSATHRMTNDRRHRIDESGRVETLEAIEGMFSWDPNIPGSQEKAAQRSLERNQRIAWELRQSGLHPAGDINAFLRTNDVPRP